MDQTLDRQSSEIHALREETRAGFAELRAEMADLRRDLQADHVALQRHVLSIIAGTTIVLIALLGAFVAAQF
jgi:hypothetical protein